MRLRALIRQFEGSSSWINMLHSIDEKQPAGWVQLDDIIVVHPVQIEPTKLFRPKLLDQPEKI